MRVSPSLFPYLAGIFGAEVEIRQLVQIKNDSQNWHDLELIFESLHTARTKLLGLGSAIEVLTPLALRLSLADFAEQTTNLYRQKS